MVTIGALGGTQIIMATKLSSFRFLPPPEVLALQNLQSVFDTMKVDGFDSTLLCRHTKMYVRNVSINLSRSIIVSLR